MDRKTVFSNVIWRFFERIGAELVGFIVSIILARILSPSDYGTLAIIMVFSTLLMVFVDSGLGNALIQKKNADQIDFSTVFFTNIIFCTILYFLLFLASPYIARFYGDDAITGYMRVLGLTVLIAGVKNVQMAYVSKNMLFKRFFFATLGGTIVAGVVGIIMAYSGYGVWALVAQQVINTAIDTIILWITVRWRPEKKFDVQRLKGLFSYGWKLLVSSLLDKLETNITQLVVGKVFSPTELAYFNRGNQLSGVIAKNINLAVDSVLLPAMSSEQDSREKVKNMARRSIQMSIFIMAPLMMGLAFCGHSFIGLLLTDKWLPCVFYLRIFCIIYMFYPIHTTNLNVIKSLGRSDLFLKLEIEKKVLGTVVLLATIFISIKAVAIGTLAASFIAMYINSAPNKKLLEYGCINQIKDITGPVLMALAMGAIIYPIEMLGLSYFVTLLIQVPLGTVIYLGGSKLFHLEAFEYVFEFAKSFLKKRH